MRRRKPLLFLGLLSLLLSLPAGCDWLDDDDGKSPFAVIPMDNGTTGSEPYRFDGSKFTLLADINPDGNSWPMDFREAGGKVYFVADDGTSGRELWVTDGTPAGTRMVKDINPEGGSDPIHLAPLGNRLCFTANDGEAGFELWVTDGTGAGTTLLRDIRPGADSSYPSDLTAYRGKLYFSADDGTNGAELWATDGTGTGTTLVKDINGAPFGSSYPYGFVAYGGKLCFTADDGVHGHELWATDGTADGTALVADLYPEGYASSPELLTVYNGKLYFRANDGVHGYELFVTDLTAPGTGLAGGEEINTFGDASPTDLTVSGGKLFFVASRGAGGEPTAPGPSAPVGEGRELWVTDGTAAGTRLVKDVNPSGSSFPNFLADHGGTLFFMANDGAHGYELWKSDGTAAGTVLVADWNGAGDGYGYSLPAVADRVGKGGRWIYLSEDFRPLYYIAFAPDYGYELLRTDGTAAGTTLVEDFNPGPASGVAID